MEDRKENYSLSEVNERLEMINEELESTFSLILHEIGDLKNKKEVEDKICGFIQYMCSNVVDELFYNFEEWKKYKKLNKN